MENALRFAPLLLVAVAADLAAAQPMGPSLKPQPVDSVRFLEPPSPRYDPALRLRLFQMDEETLPIWTLPFGPGADERDRRGVSFSVRPGRGLKARAKIRF